MLLWLVDQFRIAISREPMECQELTYRSSKSTSNRHYVIFIMSYTFATIWKLWIIKRSVSFTIHNRIGPNRGEKKGNVQSSNRGSENTLLEKYHPGPLPWYIGWPVALSPYFIPPCPPQLTPHTHFLQSGLRRGEIFRTNHCALFDGCGSNIEGISLLGEATYIWDSNKEMV